MKKLETYGMAVIFCVSPMMALACGESANNEPDQVVACRSEDKVARDNEKVEFDRAMWRQNSQEAERKLQTNEDSWYSSKEAACDTSKRDDLNEAQKKIQYLDCDIDQYNDRAIALQDM